MQILSNSFVALAFSDALLCAASRNDFPNAEESLDSRPEDPSTLRFLDYIKGDCGVAQTILGDKVLEKLAANKDHDLKNVPLAPKEIPRQRWYHKLQKLGRKISSPFLKGCGITMLAPAMALSAYCATNDWENNIIDQASSVSLTLLLVFGFGMLFAGFVSKDQGFWSVKLPVAIFAGAVVGGCGSAAIHSFAMNGEFTDIGFCLLGLALTGLTISLLVLIVIKCWRREYDGLEAPKPWAAKAALMSALHGGGAALMLGGCGFMGYALTEDATGTLRAAVGPDGIVLITLFSSFIGFFWFISTFIFKINPERNAAGFTYGFAGAIALTLSGLLAGGTYLATDGSLSSASVLFAIAGALFLGLIVYRMFVPARLRKC